MEEDWEVELELRPRPSNSIAGSFHVTTSAGRRCPGRPCLTVKAQLAPPRLPQNELTTSIFVAEIGKPPDIAQPNDLPGH